MALTENEKNGPVEGKEGVRKWRKSRFDKTSGPWWTVEEDDAEDEEQEEGDKLVGR